MLDRIRDLISRDREGIVMTIFSNLFVDKFYCYYDCALNRDEY